MNWMTSKYKEECASCTRTIDVGERILFDFKERETYCKVFDFEERQTYCKVCGARIKPDSKRD
jgi:predicted RNA-binding Zn-ribbon protein involved in translation (DUF1610 family)